MGEKMTMEKMSVEMDILWERIKELEMTLSQKLEKTLKSTTRRFRRPSADAEEAAESMVISNKIRRDLIQLTAYHKAERRGFAGGDPTQDWLEAEQEVDRLLLGGKALHEADGEVAVKAVAPGGISLSDEDVAAATGTRQ